MKGPDVDGLRRGEEMEVGDSDVMGMDERKTDDYLDWFQRMWLEDRDAKSVFACYLHMSFMGVD